MKSKGALHAIIKAGEVNRDDLIIEIGPGKGALTRPLLDTGARVIAVEKDRELIPILSEKFAPEIKSNQLILIEADILNLTVVQLVKVSKVPNTKPSSFSYKLIANIPYYITGEIIRKFFEEKNQPKKMVLLVQKEVATRIVARDGKESILSIACKAYSIPKYIETVKKDMFAPAPKVDSAIILFNHLSKELFTQNKISEERFFEVVKVGFSHKRKKLSGNLKNLKTNLNLKKFEEIKDKRAENLQVKDWVDLIETR